MLVKNKKGFTLIELLISISILGFIIGISYTLFVGNIRFFSQKTSQVNSENDIRILSDWLTKDLKNTKVEYVKKDKDGNYNIGSVKYVLTKVGEVQERNVFKLERQSPKEGNIEMMNSLEEGSKGFNIKMPSKDKPYYNVSLTIIDRFNKDKSIDFKVSYLNGKVSINDNEEKNDESENPFIDLNNNERLDGDDYRINFDSKGVYDSNNDKRYKNNSKLVFDKDFKACGNERKAFIVSGGMLLKDNVKLNTVGESRVFINTSQLNFKLRSYLKSEDKSSINILSNKFPHELINDTRNLQASFIILNSTFNAVGNSSINIEGASVKITPEYQPNSFPPEDINSSKERICRIYVEENGRININAGSLAINWAVCRTKERNSSISFSGGSVDASTIKVYGDGKVTANGRSIY